MKFSFIQPKLSDEFQEMCSNAWPPLGILYCATTLENEGFEVSVLDQSAKGFSTDQVVDWVKKEDPEILGLSVLASSSKEAGKIAGLSKNFNPNMTIVFGNYHPTFSSHRILNKYHGVDIVVRGEGEYTCLELARCLQKNGKLNKILGITYRSRKGKIVDTEERALVGDVDSIDFPNRRLLECEYASKIFGVKTATRKFTSILSSRGCPFQCIFCACRNFARGRWRPRSVGNIVEELELLYSEGYREFLFVDDNFTLNPRRVVKLCHLLRKRKLNIEWFCDSRVDSCGFDTFREMVKAGCKTLYFGMESANQRILNYYQKSTTPDQSEKAARNARKAGVDITVGSFIVGAPDESRKEIENTLRFAQRIDINVPSFNILCAPVGSPLWNQLLEKGFVNEEAHWEESVFVPKIVPSAVPFDEVSSMIFRHFKAFYLNPKRLFSESVRMLTSSFRIRLFFTNATHLGEAVNAVKQGMLLK